MKLKNSFKEVYSVILVESTVLILDKSKITDFDIGKVVEFYSIGNVKRSKNFIGIIFDKKIEIYDSNLNFMNRVENQEISLDSGLTIFDSDQFVLHNFIDSENLLYFNNKYVKARYANFWGSILNDRYVLNYPNGVFNNPVNFHCGSLLERKTYWEYQCKDGEQAISRWYVWGGYLLFCTHKSGYFNGNLMMIKLDSGEIAWQIPINYTDLNFDEKQGIFVSLWASDVNGKNFQIIDLNKREVESGEVVTDYSLENVNVHWQLQSFADRKLYFVDNLAYFNISADKSPKFGRFDLDTKQIDFLQELPEAAGSQISQTIYCDGNLYLRTTINELFIFE